MIEQRRPHLDSWYLWSQVGCCYPPTSTPGLPPHFLSRSLGVTKGAGIVCALDSETASTWSDCPQAEEDAFKHGLMVHLRWLERMRN